MNTKIKKATTVSPENTIVTHLDIRQIQRGNIDIGKWKNALTAAESTTNPQRKQLYDMYADILVDPHLTSVIEKRKSEICNADIIFTDAKGTPIDPVNDFIRGQWFSRFLRDILDTQFWGYTAIEFTAFEPTGAQYTLIDRRHIHPETHMIVRTPTDTAGWDFTDPTLSPWILTAGHPTDLGLLVKAAPYAIYKRNAMADYAQYCEQFGQPIRKATYNPYDDATRRELQRALTEAGSSLVITIPEGTSMELLYPSNTSGSKDLYADMIATCDAQMSKLFLHETLTTEQGDKGARSLGEVHAEVADAVHAADRRFILSVLNDELLWRLEQRGYPVSDGQFAFETHEDIDLDKQILIDRALTDMGIPLDDDYFYEAYSRPRPADYTAMKEAAEATRALRSGTPAGVDVPPAEQTTAHATPIPYRRSAWERIRALFQ